MFVSGLFVGMPARGGSLDRFNACLLYVGAFAFAAFSALSTLKMVLMRKRMEEAIERGGPAEPPG